MDIIQKEVEAAEEAARKAKEAEEAEAAAASGTDEGDLVDLSTDTDTDDSAEEVELDLSAMPDSEIAEEGFKADESKTILVEDGVLIEDADDLPTPEEADTERDFTENL